MKPNFMPTMIAVGLPYPESPCGGISLAEGNKSIVHPEANLTPDKIEAVQSGKGRFWLIYEAGIIILQIRFQHETKSGVSVEGEFAFHVGLYDERGIKCSIDSIEENYHYIFNFTLVDENNIVRALRVFTLGPSFLNDFKKLIERQRLENPSTSTHHYRYMALSNQYSMNQLRKKAVCYCNVGQDTEGAV